MHEPIVRMRLMILFLITLFSGVVWLVPYTSAVDTHEYFTVHFFDVGQGDAIFIETPEGIQVLVDGGRDSTILRELAEVMAFGDRTIDMVIGTHPDSDHIGGLIDVFSRYDVGIILTTENEGESETAATYATLRENEGAEVLYARRGQVFTLGASTTLEVLFPDTDVTSYESNASSIVVKVTYGDSSLLLTGDSPKRIEEYLVLTEGEHLESTVLKIGHHGSRTSTSELFLREVDPTYAVISAEKNSRYGHPHVEVTDMLFNHGVETLSTAEEGTITFLSDGRELWVQ